MFSIKHTRQRLSTVIKLALATASVTLTLIAAPSFAYADPISCPAGWTGTYPDCVAPTGSPDITQRDLKIAGLAIAVFLGWVTVRAFRFRRDG